MKSYKILLLIIFTAIILTACTTAGLTNNESRAYSNEEENAVNTLKAGSKYSKKSESMQSIKNAVIEILGDNYWPDATITKEELESETGITPDMYNDYMAEWQHTKTSIDMLIIIEAKEESLLEVEILLNKYREKQIGKYSNQIQNMSKVFASRIEIINNYICFVQLGADTSQIPNTDKNAIIALCQEENEKAIDIIEKTILK